MLGGLEPALQFFAFTFVLLLISGLSGEVGVGGGGAGGRGGETTARTFPGPVSMGVRKFIVEMSTNKIHFVWAYNNAFAEGGGEHKPSGTVPLGGYTMYIQCKVRQELSFHTWL